MLGSGERKAAGRNVARAASGSGVGLLPEGIEEGGAYTAVPRTVGQHERRVRSGSEDSSHSDSSSMESQEDVRTGEYEFDPITEYMIKVGRQDARLDVAWDFYAKYTLPKYTLKEEDGSANADRPGSKYRLQEPGESGGHFYNLWETPLSQLGDFGAGVGMYFQTLTVMGIVFFLAGVANTASMVYYRSDDYSGGQLEVNEQISKGSAVCTLRKVVCLSEDCSYWSENHRPCPLNLQAGLVDGLTTLVMFLILYVVSKVQGRHTRRIDEAVQTAKDYSIMVLDPEPGDTRPAKWRDFFQRRFGHVTYVTVAVKSGKLMRLLSERFAIVEKIRYEAAGKEEEDIAKDSTAVMSRERWPAPWYKRLLMKAGIGGDIVYLHEQLVNVDAQVAKLRGRKKAAKVFVTFETEHSQRECLRAMTTGVLCSGSNQTTQDNEDLVRRGNVLSVCAAPEPGDVIWENLQVSVLRRSLEFLARALIAAVIIAVVGFIIYVLAEVHPTAAAVFIAVSNSTLPSLMTWLTANPKGGEHHHTHSVYQKSLMLKIVIAQWMNTAFVIYVIQNIDTSPDEAYVNQVSKILWADAFVQPLMKVVDIGARFKQYVLAPFEKTQSKMNKHFLGKKVNMAERYASMLKTMFVALFFSAIFPQGYYVAAMSMFMTYWSSKYCLFNRWRRPPPSDDSLTVMTRRYLAIALVIHILVSLQFYAGWPFDNLCPTDYRVTQAFANETSLGVNQTEAYRLLSDYPQVNDTVYEYCQMDSDAVWGEMPEPWMSVDQMVIVWLFSMFANVMTFLVALMLFGKTLYHTLRRLCKGQHAPVGRENSVVYSKVNQIEAYVPEVRDTKRPHSLIATDLHRVNTQHISWTGDFEAYNLCSVDSLPGLTRKQRAAMFSRVAFYPPPSNGDRGLPTPTRMRGIPL